MDPDYPLPQAEADVVASSLPATSSFEAQHPGPSTSRSPRSSTVLENEDLQLQAALHASLDGQPTTLPMPLSHMGPIASGSGALSPGGPMLFSAPSQRPAPPPIPHHSTRPADRPMQNPVAASMARNQAMLERMRREQEVALREHEGAPRFVDPLNRAYPGAGGLPRHVGDEEEQLRRAIAESEAMAREQGQGPTQADSDAAGTGLGSDNTQPGEWTQERVGGGRVYDDEDADLQAALQASLTTASGPAGAHIPDTTTAPPRASPGRRPHAAPSAGADEDDEDDEKPYDEDDGDDTATEETLSGTEDPPPLQAANDDLSIEEMRRRRLARFGGP
jgi:ataxin-3